MSEKDGLHDCGETLEVCKAMEDVNGLGPKLFGLPSKPEPRCLGGRHVGNLDSPLNAKNPSRVGQAFPRLRAFGFAFKCR